MRFSNGGRNICRASINLSCGKNCPLTEAQRKLQRRSQRIGPEEAHAVLEYNVARIDLRVGAFRVEVPTPAKKSTKSILLDNSRYMVNTSYSSGRTIDSY